MERRILKSKSPRRTAELFVLVEDRINTRKAMEKETACTFKKLMNKQPKTISDKRK